MASAKKNLIGTEIKTTLGGGAVDLNLRWNEKGTHWRRIAAETFRIAALVSDASEDARWCIDPHAECGMLGGTTLGTWIRLELAEGNAAEAAMAEKVLRQVVAGLQK